VKISSNSSLAERKKHWIDFNAGRLIEGEPIAKVNHQLFQDLLSYASGHKQTNNEKFDFREIAIFKDGVTL
jgi:altronate hydrolase